MTSLLADQGFGIITGSIRPAEFTVRSGHSKASTSLGPVHTAPSASKSQRRFCHSDELITEKRRHYKDPSDPADSDVKVSAATPLR